MGDYPLEKLTTRDFEHLVQSLVIHEFGLGALTWGDGPDGGREATVDLASKDAAEQRTLIVQAKFLQRPPWPVSRQADWATKELRSEVARFFETRSSRTLPYEYLFVTNAILTPFPGGGKDKFREELADFARRGKFGNCRLWDYDHICRLLDNAQSIRERFAELVTPGDVLHAALRQLTSSNRTIEATAVTVLQRELLKEMSSTDSGLFSVGPSATTNWLEGLIDLPVAPQSEATGGQFQNAIGVLLDEEGSSRYLALIGGAGQGKSTITRFVAQVCRAAWISTAAANKIAPESLEAIQVADRALKQLGYRGPPAVRFPILLDAAALATYIGAAESEEKSLWHCIARSFKAIAKRDVSVDQAREWISGQPSLIIIDGYDEVSDPVRSEFVAVVREFMQDTLVDGSDIRLIVASRPNSYVADLDQQGFSTWLMAKLPNRASVNLAQRLLAGAVNSSVLVERFERALELPELSELASAPLHVVLLTALLEEDRALPSSRYSLFSRYRDYAFARQALRRDDAGMLVGTHKALLEGVHRRVAFELHRRGEVSSDWNPFGGGDVGLDDFTPDRGSLGKSMPIATLAPLIAEIIDSDHVAAAKETAERILHACRERLGLMLSDDGNSIRFETRSFQEFFAAEYLWDSKSDRWRRARFRAVADNPYWSNVARFFAAKAFQDELLDQCDMRDTVVQVVSDLNTPVRTGSYAFTYPGTRIAVQVLADIGLEENNEYIDRLWPSPAAAAKLWMPDLQRLAYLASDTIPDRGWFEELGRAAAGPGDDEIDSEGAFKVLQVFAATDHSEAARQLDILVRGAEDDPGKLARLLARLVAEALYKWQPDLEKLIRKSNPMASGMHCRAPVTEAMAPWVSAAFRILCADFMRDSPLCLKADSCAWPLWGVDTLDALRSVHAISEIPFEYSEGWERWLDIVNFSRFPEAETLSKAALAVEGVDDWWSLRTLPWPVVEARSDAIPRCSVRSWRQAEARWQAEGVTIQDVTSYLEYGALDERVSRSGFPFACVHWSLPGEHFPDVPNLFMQVHSRWASAREGRGRNVLKALLIPMADYIARQECDGATPLDCAVDVIREAAFVGENISAELVLRSLARCRSQHEFAALANVALGVGWSSGGALKSDADDLHRVVEISARALPAREHLEMCIRLAGESSHVGTWESIERSIKETVEQKSLPPVWKILLYNEKLFDIANELKSSGDIFAFLKAVSSRPGWSAGDKWAIVDGLGVQSRTYFGNYGGSPPRPVSTLSSREGALGLPQTG